MEDRQTECVCHRCVRDTYLATEIVRGGQLRTCTYCVERRQSFTLDELADRIHDVVIEHFRLTPDHPVDVDEFIDIAMGRDWERKGCPPTDLVAEIAGLEEAIAEDVVSLLSEEHSYSAVRGGGENPYSTEAAYEANGPDTGPFRTIWDSVPNSIRHRSRFFNADAETALDRLFADLAEFRTTMGELVIQVIDPEVESTPIWRARRGTSESQVKSILANPESELGPPPPEHATAGRMNAAGIPVFYGALDPDTCIAEIRPPVGRFVVVGQFDLLRPVRLLDVNLLQNVAIETTYFEPAYTDRSNRVAFLTQLALELTKPVVPEDETTEYLSTQLIAEYLAHRVNPRIDGIIFRSSQTDPAGHNLVLFNHASTGRAVRPPGRNYGRSQRAFWKLRRR